MQIGVVGTGYVGLVTGVGFAEHGVDVTCVDNNPEKVELMRAGIPPIHEDGLAPLMNRHLKEGRLKFATDLREGVEDSAAVFLALPTPESEDGSADLSHIMHVARELGPLLSRYTVIVNKSTVPTGTAKLVASIVGESATVPFDVVSNPEFLREGRAIQDVKQPDRIVIGLSSERAREVMSELYEPFVRNGRPIRYMSPESAELTKYGANGALAAKISFNNELALVAEAVGADIRDVLQAMGDDPRIGNQFMHPSSGWGGSCFPKDSRALIKIAEDVGLEFMTMEAADRANDRQKQVIIDKIISHYDGHLSGKRFALWGLAFKKDTDDIRESPALEVLDALTNKGAEVVAYDPAAMENVRLQRSDTNGLLFADNMYDALDGADALIIATDWEIFTTPDADKIKTRLKAPVVFDGRIMLDPEVMHRQGIHYTTIGRPTVAKSA